MGCNCFLYLPSPLNCSSSLRSFSSDVLSYTLMKFFDDKYIMLYSSRLIFKRYRVFNRGCLCYDVEYLDPGWRRNMAISTPKHVGACKLVYFLLSVICMCSYVWMIRVGSCLLLSYECRVSSSIYIMIVFFHISINSPFTDPQIIHCYLTCLRKSCCCCCPH